MRYSGANLRLESLTMAGDAAVGKNQQQGSAVGKVDQQKGAAANRGREEVESEGGVESEEQV